MKDFDDNKNERKDDSFLSSMKKKNVFQVPDNYFANLAEELEDKIEDEKVFNDSPLLNAIEKKHIFQPPKEYFESFPKQFQQKINTELNRETKQSKIFSLWSKPKYSVRIAAAIALLISLGIWLVGEKFPTSNENPMAMLSEISTENLLASVDVSDYDLDMIIETLGDEAIDNFNNVAEIPITDEDVSEVLDQIDISELEAELMEISD